jgi:hypothetical protein
VSNTSGHEIAACPGWFHAIARGGGRTVALGISKRGDRGSEDRLAEVLRSLQRAIRSRLRARERARAQTSGHYQQPLLWK